MLIWAVFITDLLSPLFSQISQNNGAYPMIFYLQYGTNDKMGGFKC